MNWWERQDAALKQVRTHPSILPQLTSHFTVYDAAGNVDVEKTYKRTAHTMARLRKKGKVLHGTVQIQREGRPNDYFCGWAVRRRMEIHEINLTDYCMLYPEVHWIRGPKVNKDLRPDAEGRRGPLYLWVEYYTNSQDMYQVQERLKFYREALDKDVLVPGRDVLVILSDSDERMMELLSWGEAVTKLALYGNIERIWKDPYGYAYLNAASEWQRLKEPSE